MKTAIATDNGQVSAHFGRCPSYTIIEIQDGKVLSKNLVDNPGHQPGFIPNFLNDMDVNVIIAGGMGRRAIDLFGQYNIETVLGVSGNIENVIEEYLSGKLAGGESLCKPGGGKGYGLDKETCDH